MASILSQLLSNAATTLSGAGKPADLQIYRTGLAPKDTDVLPFAVVKAGKSKRNAVGRDAVERMTDIVIVLYCKREQDENTEDTLDPYVCWITDSIGSNKTLGGLAMSCEEGQTEWDAQPGDPSICAAVITFSARYLTKRTSQETRA